MILYFQSFFAFSIEKQRSGAFHNKSLKSDPPRHRVLDGGVFGLKGGRRTCHELKEYFNNPS